MKMGSATDLEQVAVTEPKMDLDSDSGTEPDLGLHREAKTTMTYLEQHSASGIRIDDTVQITRKAQDYEAGWQNAWPVSMDAYVGRIGVVIANEGWEGFKVSFIKKPTDWLSSYCFPCFVLKKIEIDDQSQQYIVKQSKSSIVPGDFVKVQRSARSYENGWGMPWTEAMNKTVGKTGQAIRYGSDNDGIVLLFPDIQDVDGTPFGGYYPYFALERVDEQEE